MSRLPRRVHTALTLLGVGAGTLLVPPAIGFAQTNSKPQFGAPTGVAPPAYAPAVRFTPPQPAPADPAPVAPPRSLRLTAASAVVPPPREFLPVVPPVDFPPPPMVPQATLAFQDRPSPPDAHEAALVIMPALIIPVPDDSTTRGLNHRQ